MKKYFLLFLLLIPLALAQDFSDKIIIENEDMTFEDEPAGFTFVEQSVIESQITSSRTLTPDDKVSAKLIYLSKEFDALEYRIYIYYYDQTLKEHSNLISIFSPGRPLAKGQRREMTFLANFPLITHLEEKNENHYIGIVGVLRLKVPISELSNQQIQDGDCSQDTCWIYERFNSIGDIGTNAFNPPFFYHVSATKNCQTGYTGEPFCDNNLIRQNFIEQDCTQTEKSVKSCGFNQCISGSCVETSCKLTGKVLSQACTNNQLIRKTYDQNCEIIEQNLGICDDSDNDILPPNNLELPPEEDCVPVRTICSDGEEVELFGCVNNQLVASDQCDFFEGDTTSSKPTDRNPTSLDKVRATINNNPGLAFLAILLVIVATVLILRRIK